MASTSHRGGPYYGADPYRSREGLTTRTAVGSDEIQLRIDPLNADLDDEITGLRKQIRQLKGVAQEIESEATFQNDLINKLYCDAIMTSELIKAQKHGANLATQMTLVRAEAGVKNNLRQLRRSIIQEGSSHVTHVVLFALLCFSVVYLWSKFSRR